MINPEDLLNAKLNKVQKPVEKSSISSKQTQSSNWFSEEKEKLTHYRENQILAQLDQWIPFVPKEISFDTIFIDIQRDCALKLIKIHEQFEVQTKKLELEKISSEEKDQKEREIVNSLMIELKNNEKIQELMKQIDECSLWDEKKSPLFFKLSSRSPKDVTKLNGKDLMSLFQKDLVEHYPLEEDQKNNSKRVVSFSRAATEFLKITSSDEVLELMLRSTRVNDDLIESYVDFWNENSSLNKIALRRWDQNIDILLEFRTFVVCGKLRAISQYNHFAHVEEIEKYHEQVQDLIEKFVKYLKENLDKHMIFKHLVADFAVYPRFFTDLEKNQVNEESIFNGEYIKLIELNPYEESTGTCLFSWKSDTQIIPMPPPSSLPQNEETINLTSNTSSTAFRFITTEYKENYLEKHLDKIVAPEYKFLLL